MKTNNVRKSFRFTLTPPMLVRFYTNRKIICGHSIKQKNDEQIPNFVTFDLKFVLAYSFNLDRHTIGVFCN